jgi:hypothetical protein
MITVARFNPLTQRIENFTASEKGADGLSIVGPKGPKGEPGKDGQSIVGPKGPKGEPGKDGESIVGPSGKDGQSIVGPKGENGKDGIDGKHNLIFHSLNKPNDSIGNENDWAFTAANEIYFKKNNSWNFYAQINSGYSKRAIIGFIEAYLKAGINFDIYFNENVYIGKSLYLGLGSVSENTPPLKFISTQLINTPQSGSLEYYNGHLYLTDGARHVIPTSNGTKTTTTTVVNTTTETVIYTYDFLSDELHSEERVVLRLDGVYSSENNSDSFTLRFKVAGNTMHSITRTAKGTLVDVGFESTYSGTIRSIGVSGQYVDFCKLLDNDSISCVGDSSVHTIDTTQGFTFQVTVQWNNAKPGNSLSCTQGELCFYH